MRGAWLLALLLATAPALAAPSKAQEREARAHYDRGMSRYALHDFEAAIDEFKHAYALTEAPGLLFNLAQASRLAKKPEEALHFYRTYLRLKPNAPNRKDVERFIAMVEPQARAASARPAEPAPQTSAASVERTTEQSQTPDIRAGEHTAPAPTSEGRGRAVAAPTSEARGERAVAPATSEGRGGERGAASATSQARGERAVAPATSEGRGGERAVAPPTSEGRVVARTSEPRGAVGGSAARRPPSGRAELAAGLALAGVGIVLLGTGIRFGLSADETSSRISGVAGNGGAWSAELRSAWDDGQRDAAAATALYTVGAAALVTGVVLTAVGGTRRAAHGRWSAAPTRTGAQVAWCYAF